MVCVLPLQFNWCSRDGLHSAVPVLLKRIVHAAVGTVFKTVLQAAVNMPFKRLVAHGSANSV